MKFLERAIKDGHAQITGEGNKKKITYIAVNHTERYSDPEEEVRAEYWAELIYRYGYEPARIGVEVTVPDRTPSDRADLVVFRDDTRKRPYAVIECKRDGITDSEFNQAVEQACGNGTWAKFRASFVGVVAGRTRRFLDFTSKYAVLEREANIIADLPVQYGKPEEFKYLKGGPLDIQPVSKEDLITAIKKCHQTLWGGGKLSPPAAFGELCKIIFVKINDEQARRKKGEPYEFQIKTHEPSRRLAERIRGLYEQQKAKEPDVFTQTINIDDQTLRTVVLHLEGINLSKTDLDTKGVAFEQFMDGFFKGDFGQYFTPREIISFAVDMMEPKADELVLDPSCGSGGFLLYALDKVRREASEYWEKGTDEHFRYWHDFAQKRLYGLEINDEIARVAKMNMIIHDDGHTNVCGEDALERFERIDAKTSNNGFKKNRFDLILTNPPFGAQVALAEHPYLADYELGRQAGRQAGRQDVTHTRKNQKTEILFIERIYQFLKPGTGRAAVVLPDGILTNSSLQYVRDFILERFQLLAVVSLPQTAFSHYGAGVKASIVFLRKRADDEQPDDNEAIFMAAPEKIGYDATGRKCENQLPEVVKQYRKFQKNPEPSEDPRNLYAVSRAQLIEDKRLNPEYYHPERQHVIRSMQHGGKGLRSDFLGNIVDFIRDTTEAGPSERYIGLANIQSNTGEFIETNEEVPTGLCFKYKERDVLFARLRPYLNKVHLAEDSGICSTEFHVIRIKPVKKKEYEILPDYLAAVLRSSIVLTQTKHMMTGNTHPRLANEDVFRLRIPIPKLSVQKKIQKEIADSREKARSLRAEAEQEWEKAKARFERALLGQS